MTDERPTEEPPLEHDEFHSSLEVDDSSGWRVFIVPGVLLLFVIGAILFIVLYQGSPEPDPRIAERLKNTKAEVYTEPQAAPVTSPVAPSNATWGNVTEPAVENVQNAQ